MKKLLLFVIACTLGLFSTVNAQNRLESITYANTSNNITYVYEEGTNKVVEVRHGVYNDEYKSQYKTVLTYNAGQLVSTEYGNYYDNSGIDKNSSSSADAKWTIVEYTYADGKLTSYIVKEYENWTLYQEPCDIKNYTLTYEGDNVVEITSTCTYWGYDFDSDSDMFKTGNPSKVTYSYDNGRLVGAEYFYYDQWASTPGFFTDYTVTYAYNEAGNCVSATKSNGEITDYIYDETKLSADVYTFSFPHEVKPVSTNIVANTETYRLEKNQVFNEETQEWEEIGEPVKGEVTAATYHYTFATVAKPIAPVVAAGAVTETTVELSWAAVEGATSYNVYVGEAEAVSVTGTTYTATDLTPATEYTFTVTAVNEGGESSASNVVKVTTEALTPLAPVAAATKITDTEITLAWEAVAKATSYNVYVGEATEAVNVTETTYTATGLTPETEYSFVVTAANEHGESNKPEAVVVKTKAAKVVLPENMVAIGDGDYLATSFPFELCNMGFNENTQSTFYGVSQQLYTAEEIAKEAGYIKSYALKFAGPKTGLDFETAAEQDDVVVEFEIYVQNTELEVLQEGTEPASTQVVEAKDLYYSGKTTLVNGDWTTFEFDYPFEYTGGNIIVTIYGISVENGKANYYPFYTYTTESTAITTLYNSSIEERPTTGKAVTSMNPNWIRNQVLLTFAEEGEVIPERPKEYRLESVESFMSTAYTYDDVFTNRVVSMEKEGVTSTFTYNEAGQVETIVDTHIGEDEEGNPTLDTINTVEYVYNEDGTIATYSEITAGWEPMTTEFVYEEGKLVKTVIADYEMEVTFAYNAEGLLSEKVTSYSGDVDSKEAYTYDAQGRLVEYGYYGYDAWDLLDYYLSEGVTYTYDVNGNCTYAKSYQVFEGEKSYFQTVKYFYDETIANEDVYSFELPHVAMTDAVPSQVNVLVKELSYYTEYNEEGEAFDHTYIMTVYNYNPAIEMAPITPMNLVAEVVEGTVKLTWEAFVDAESFIVYQDGEAVAEDVKEGVYTIEGLEDGEYIFAVQAVNAVGKSAVTEEVEVTVGEIAPEPEVPSAPKVKAEATSDSTIVLTWAAVDGATNYNVYSADTLVANVTETTYTVTGLEAEKEYCFNVTAVNEVGGESAKSENACAITLKEGNDPVVLEAPVVQVVEITETTIVIAWNPVESATNYKVFANDQLITTLPDTIAGFRELTPNTEYCFTVVAINEVGDESAPSEKVCATTSGEGIAENAAAFNIYPNPVADKLFIETEATVEEVTIYTLTGVMIYSEVNYNNTINVSDLSGGVYFIKVRTDNGEVVKRFIKK